MGGCDSLYIILYNDYIMLLRYNDGVKVIVYYRSV